MIRSTEDFRSLLKAARRAGTPLLAVGRPIRPARWLKFRQASAARPKPLYSPGTSWAASPHATSPPKKPQPMCSARRLLSLVRRMYCWPFTRALR